MAKQLWKAEQDRQANSHMNQFLQFVQKNDRRLDNYDDLYRWSIEHRPLFWSALAAFTNICWRKRGERILIESPEQRMRQDRWFPDWELNFAENLLQGAADDEVAIVGLAEGAPVRSFDRAQLRREVARVANWLKDQGIKKGDRVAGVMANTPEAIVAMLGTVSLGAIWSSCSPDFGTGGIVDRLGQVEPKCVFFTSGYRYAEKFFDCIPTAKAVWQQLPSCEQMVLVSNGQEKLGKETPFKLWEDVRTYEGKAASASSSQGEHEPEFVGVPFDHPLYIMFSSGTTGVPKCIVHGHGGTLLQHKKELMLHSDIGPGSRLLYFTTCGWMMWNWMVSALSTGASVVTFDGSVTKPHADVLWRAVGDHRVTAFGTSPKYLSYCMNEGIQPGDHTDLSQLETILSTGSPLLPEHYQWIYDQFSKVHLASISGGTDIVSCFMLGNPLRGVVAGEIQGPGLGMAVEAWDEEGRSLRDQKGELVCVSSFPSMPVGFWQDSDGSKYQEAYFDYYQRSPEVWRHGDYIEIRSSTGGIIVYGRSDATLNPGGVRIGTAEIYRQVEALKGVVDSLAVGLPAGDDVQIILFVKLADHVPFTAELDNQIRQRIRAELTPRHVPARIIPVRDIPYTRSGKKVEIAVRKALQGEEVANRDALANPDSLDEYRQITKQWQGQ